MIRITEDLLEQISKNVKSGYPKEVCGVLAGERDIEIKTVKEVHPVTNLESAKDRFNMDSKEFKRIDDELKARGLAVIGVYHSHPDAPASPSETDRATAWPVYSYLIFSVIKGKGVTAKSWELNESSKTFEPEELDIIDGEIGEA
ncbi:MAG: M67 family metallopeptidase [Candidatus Omnitrophica bacterium]|nr:M67 family metallopeptidase [Candidatus Omnitrophota bacterium]